MEKYSVYGKLFGIRKRQQKPAFSQFDSVMSIDKSFENSIENILNHPYLNRIDVSCINIELLSV